ncbi:MAG: alpha/beta hydrolase family protein [Thermoanaerobaculia bacterium]
MSRAADSQPSNPACRRAVSADGTELAFDLYRREDSPLAVVVIPGFWRTRKYQTLQEIAARIARNTATCVVMDCRGHGQSGGVFEFNRSEHEDVAAVTRSLIEETGARRIVLLGFSAGGAIAVSTAARHRELPIAGVVLVSSVSDFLHVVPRPNPFTIHRHLSLGQAVRPPRFHWPGDLRLPVIEDAASVPVPICLIHARNDWLVSHRHSETLHRHAPEAELHILEIRGRYHADKLFDVAPGLVWPIIDEFVGHLEER